MRHIKPVALNSVPAMAGGATVGDCIQRLVNGDYFNPNGFTEFFDCLDCAVFSKNCV